MTRSSLSLGSYFLGFSGSLIILNIFYNWHSIVFLVIITVMEIIIQTPGFYMHFQDAVLLVQFCIDGIIHIASQIKI